MNRLRPKITRAGMSAALLTPLFLGMNPIFGKLAYQEGTDPFTVAALRTIIAVMILWILYYIFFRHYLFIYPAGLMNCVAIGAVNGIGSLMYYNGLLLLDASIAQLINGMYLLFVVLLTRIGGQVIGWKTIIRVIISLIGILFITGGVQGEISWLGVGLMLGNALLFAGTVVMSQRALYDMPAQTVTFYVLATMAVIVTMARLAYNIPFFTSNNSETTLNAFWAILGLAVTTALSRLLMFLSVKGLGSLQTTLLAVLEMAISITLAHWLLKESLTSVQWIGVVMLLGSLFLPVESVAPNISPLEYLPDLTRIQLLEIAFTHAFGPKKDTKELNILREMLQQEKYTTHEMRIVNDLYVNELLSKLPSEEISTQSEEKKVDN